MILNITRGIRKTKMKEKCFNRGSSDCNNSKSTADYVFLTRFPDLSYTKRLNLSDVPLSKDKYWSIVAYNQSKLCNLLFSMELNRHLKSKGVTCNAVHPGNLIYTSLPKNSWFYWLLFLMARPFAKTAVSKPSHPLKWLKNANLSINFLSINF